MKKYFIFIIFLFVGFVFANAQKFPVPVLDGSTVKIQSDKGNRVFSVENDTLWIFNGNQFKNALAKAKELELAEEQIHKYNMQVEIYKQRSNEKDSLLSVVKKDRDYYKNNWTMCTEDIEKEIRKNKRKSLFNKLALAGIPVAFVIGFFVAK
jgi:hypothetical protein